MNILAIAIVFLSLVGVMSLVSKPLDWVIDRLLRRKDTAKPGIEIAGPYSSPEVYWSDFYRRQFEIAKRGMFIEYRRLAKIVRDTNKKRCRKTAQLQRAKLRAARRSVRRQDEHV